MVALVLVWNMNYRMKVAFALFALVALCALFWVSRMRLKYQDSMMKQDALRLAEVISSSTSIKGYAELIIENQNAGFSLHNGRNDRFFLTREESGINIFATSNNGYRFGLENAYIDLNIGDNRDLKIIRTNIPYP